MNKKYITALMASLLCVSSIAIAQQNTHTSRDLTVIYNVSSIAVNTRMKLMCGNIELMRTSNGTRAEFPKLPSYYPASASCKFIVDGYLKSTPPLKTKRLVVADFVMKKDGSISQIKQYFSPGQALGIYTPSSQSHSNQLPITLVQLDIRDHMINYKDSTSPF